ncbi:MAG: glutathione S-transferase N-terminal domain-containing protein [Tissierellia bacterium]|nr:glutathione S-transferase N-terminal domain-containing protein [Tissierellia bacterium]
MANPVLYSGRFCPFCKRVELFIRTKGLEDKVSKVLIDQDPQARQRLIEEGGKSQIPCLEHDGQWLYESKDIMAWLEKEYL